MTSTVAAAVEDKDVEEAGAEAEEEATPPVVEMDGDDDDDDDETGSSMSDKENKDPRPSSVRAKKAAPAAPAAATTTTMSKRHAFSAASMNKKKSALRSFQKARMRYAVYRANYEVGMRRVAVTSWENGKKTDLYTRVTNTKPLKIPGQLYPMMNLIISAITTNLLCKTAEITKYRRSKTISARDVACALHVTRRSKIV